jgi:hypothetical protein
MSEKEYNAAKAAAAIEREEYDQAIRRLDENIRRTDSIERRLDELANLVGFPHLRSDKHGGCDRLPGDGRNHA